MSVLDKAALLDQLVKEHFKTKSAEEVAARLWEATGGVYGKPRTLSSMLVTVRSALAAAGKQPT